jgi:hypothetical protein
VSADVTRQGHWISALTHFHHHYYPVKRLVFDEGHYVLTSSDFRNSLCNVYELRTLPMQFVIMSGSVPPIAEPAMIEAFGLINSTIVIRTPTRRPELRLILRNRVKDAQDVVQLAMSIYAKEAPSMAPDDRTLIYVPYVAEGNKLAKLLSCDVYKSELDDDVKDAIYYRWFRGEQTIMICTSAFSAGNDYPSVRLVIHAGSPLEMVGFIQEVSRAGRDGKPAKCIIIIPCNRKAPNKANDALGHKGICEVWAMLFDSLECLRYCITLFNDGHGVRCGDDELNQICSRCESSRSRPQFIAGDMLTGGSFKRKAPSVFESAYQAAKMRKVDITAEEQSYVESFLKALTCYRATCTMCLLGGGMDSGFHPIQSCPTLDDSSRDTLNLFRRRLHYDSKMHAPICYHCHIPICHNLLHPPYGGQQNCAHPDVVMHVGWAVFHGKASLPKMQAHFGQMFSTFDAFIGWLNGPPVAGHKSNLTAVFLWYTFLTFGL